MILDIVLLLLICIGLPIIFPKKAPKLKIFRSYSYFSFHDITFFLLIFIHLVFTLEHRYFQLEEAQTVFEMLEKDYTLKLIEVSPEAYLIDVKLPSDIKEEIKLRSIIENLGTKIYNNPYTLKELRKRYKNNLKTA